MRSSCLDSSCVHQIKCSRDAYLPPQRQPLNDSLEAAVLDRQFRLLRHDFVGTVREGLKSLDRDLASSRLPYGLNVSFSAVGLQSMAYIVAEFDLPSWHPCSPTKVRRF